jgi:hypothetical protein
MGFIVILFIRFIWITAHRFALETAHNSIYYELAFFLLLAIHYCLYCSNQSITFIF